MNQPRRIFCLAISLITLLLLPLRAAAQSGTLTDDGFVSTHTGTQQLNFNGKGIVLIVAGSSATSNWEPPRRSSNSNCPHSYRPTSHKNEPSEPYRSR
jgi:hypothetical protein